MKKRMLSLTMVLCMVTALFNGMIVVAKPATSGVCGDNLTWSLDDEGVLTISGTGAMYDFTLPEGAPYRPPYNSTAPWIDLMLDIKSVIVEEGVTSIGHMAFDTNYENLESVSLPDSLERVETRAFNDANLQELTIPKNVKYIGPYAFSYNRVHNLTILTEHLETVEYYAFGCLNMLKEIVIPKSIAKLEAYAFYGCVGVEKITFEGNAVKEIGTCSFSGCDSLAEVVIPEGVELIGSYAFSDCDNLVRVVLPDSLLKIDEEAFSYCKELTSFVLSENITTIGKRAFYDCTNLKNIVIHNKVTIVDNYAFAGTFLHNVYYTGSEEEWNKININMMNDSLENATIHFNYVPEKVIHGDATGDGEINVNDVVLSVEYIGTIAAGGDFDLSKIPGGTDCLDVTGDGEINVNDAVLLTEYIGTIASGGTLDETKFPGGTFPGAKK